ncbi:MAG: NAD(P)-binding oxidoreductase [Vicinamibacterales bacterium]
MKLFVLGATGGTGRQIVTQALRAGHEVTVLARDRARVTAHHPHLTVVAGDTTAGAGAMTPAMHGHDAVISAIGRGMTFQSGRLIQRSVPGILSAMQASGVRRLVFTSALGVGATFADSPLLPKIFFVTLLRKIYADKLIGDDLIRRSGMDWTIVQPAVLTDGPLTRKYRSAEHLTLTGMPQISRADTAHFILDRINDQATFGKTLILAS